MTPYCTIHTAPLDKVLLGISMDLPRYYGEIEEKVVKRPKGVGRGKTKAAREIQEKMLDMIKNGDRVTTIDMTGALLSNRFSIYAHAKTMMNEGLIKLVKVGSKAYHWEVV